MSLPAEGWKDHPREEHQRTLSPRARVSAWLILLFLAGPLSIGCAARAPRAFEPAGAEEAARALAAWQEALNRADLLGPARLLYDARLVQGILHLPGTLAVTQRPGHLEATLAGPFGKTVARYQDGALQGEEIQQLAVEPEELRSLLAGVWKSATPQVAGVHGADALLKWEGSGEIAAVLDLPRSRLRTLTIARPQGEISAAYSGEFAPWPERIEIEEARSGNKLRLVLIGREPLNE